MGQWRRPSEAPWDDTESPACGQQRNTGITQNGYSRPGRAGLPSQAARIPAPPSPSHRSLYRTPLRAWPRNHRSRAVPCHGDHGRGYDRRPDTRPTALTPPPTGKLRGRRHGHLPDTLASRGASTVRAVIPVVGPYAVANMTTQ